MRQTNQSTFHTGLCNFAQVKRSSARTNHAHLTSHQPLCLFKVKHEYNTGNSRIHSFIQPRALRLTIVARIDPRHFLDCHFKKTTTQHSAEKSGLRRRRQAPVLEVSRATLYLPLLHKRTCRESKATLTAPSSWPRRTKADRIATWHKVEPAHAHRNKWHAAQVSRSD